MNTHAGPHSPFLLKIVCINGTIFEGYIESLVFKSHDGQMSINKNYSSVIEEVASGKIKVKLDKNKNSINFESSDGWLITEKNVCEIFVSYAKHI